MATELVRQVWCDQCMGEGNKVPADVALKITDPDTGRIILFDGCQLHSDPRVSELIKFGTVEPSGTVRKGAHPHSVKGTRVMVSCNLCGRVVGKGAGQKLHANMHSKKGQPPPAWLPV